MRGAKLILLIVAASLLSLGMIVGWLFSKLPSRAPAIQPINTATVLRQVQTLSELVTVKYVMEKVVIVEDAKWYGQDRVLLLAHGNVKAGINLQELKPGDVAIDGKKVVITLPREQITDAYLDEGKTQIIERHTGALRAVDQNLETNARRNAVDDIRRAARNAGILKDARERAEIQLRALFQGMGFEIVEFR